MPQTTPERADRWPGMDQEAIAYLRGHGFTLTDHWTWIPPSPDHEWSERELDALYYLIEEWDFGGAEPAE